MTIENFTADKLEGLAPVIIITGDDYYLGTEALDKIMALLPSAREDIDAVTCGEEQSLKDILFECNNLPFISSKRVILLLNRTNALLSEEKKALDNYLKAPSDSAILLIMDFNKIFKDYYKKICLLEANRLAINGVVSRAINIAKSYGIVIERDAANLLSEYTDRSMSRVNIEIKKLASYAMDKRIITMEDVTLCVTPESDYQIYQFIGAATKGEGKRALQILEDLLQSGTPPVVLFGSLTGHYRKLLHLSLASDTMSHNELALLLNSPEFSIAKDKEILKNYSQVSLKRIVDKLYDMEFSFKSGKITDEQALKTAIIIVLFKGGNK